MALVDEPPFGRPHKPRDRHRYDLKTPLTTIRGRAGVLTRAGATASAARRGAGQDAGQADHHRGR